MEYDTFCAQFTAITPYAQRLLGWVYRHIGHDDMPPTYPAWVSDVLTAQRVRTRRLFDEGTTPAKWYWLVVSMEIATAHENLIRYADMV